MSKDRVSFSDEQNLVIINLRNLIIERKRAKRRIFHNELHWKIMLEGLYNNYYQQACTLIKQKGFYTTPTPNPEDIAWGTLSDYFFTSIRNEILFESSLNKLQHECYSLFTSKVVLEFGYVSQYVEVNNIFEKPPELKQEVRARKNTLQEARLLKKPWTEFEKKAYIKSISDRIYASCLGRPRTV